MRKLRAKQKKLHNQAIPFLMFLLGLITSAILSEAVTIFHELLKEWAGVSYGLIRLVVFFGCLFLLGYVYSLIHKDYLGPLAKTNEEIDVVEKKKK